MPLELLEAPARREGGVGTVRYWLKGCPRCGGDLTEESDMYGRYISCVQCGYILKQTEEMHLLGQDTGQATPMVKVAA